MQHNTHNAHNANAEFVKQLKTLAVHKLKISQSEYIIGFGYPVRRITGEVCDDLDVICSGKAWGILCQAAAEGKYELKIGKTKISDTNKILAQTNYGEIEFFDRSDTGFPTDYFSFQNITQNNRYETDEYGNRCFDLETTIKLYSCVNKVGEAYVLGGKHTISRARLEKNIDHLTKIHEKIEKNEELRKEIERLKTIL